VRITRDAINSKVRLIFLLIIIKFIVFSFLVFRFNWQRIYSTGHAFAALRDDGSISAWGNVDHGGKGAPTDSGYTKIYSNRYAFAALTTNGSIKAWGDWDWGGTHAPSGSGYTL
jgi:hypothetical protein